MNPPVVCQDDLLRCMEAAGQFLSSFYLSFGWAIP
jgi:hypothetical protein